MGKGQSLPKLHLGCFPYKLGELQRIRQPDERRGNLRVHDIGRELADVSGYGLQVLLAGMNNFLHAAIGQQFPEWMQIKIRQRIDQSDLRYGGDLDQAQFWKISELADELTVIGESARAAQVADE